MHMITTENWSY